MSDPNQPPSYQPPPSYPASPPQSSSPPPSYPSAYPQPSTQPSTQPPSYPPAPGGSAAPSGTVPGRTLGIVALIGSVVLSFLSLVWLVLGIVALVRSRRAGRGNGFAIAAIIISALAFIIWTIAIIVVISGIVTVAQLCAEYGSGVYEVNGQPVTISCG